MADDKIDTNVFGIHLHSIKADFPAELTDSVREALKYSKSVVFNAHMELIENASKNIALPGLHEVWVLVQIEEIYISNERSEWITDLLKHPRVVHMPLYRYGPTTVLYKVCPH